MKEEAENKRGRGRPAYRKPEDIKKYTVSFRVTATEYKIITEAAKAAGEETATAYIRKCFYLGLENILKQRTPPF